MAIGSLIAGAASLGGGIISGLFGSSEASKNRKAQKRQIQDRVADAKKAGIHPLAALGASTGYTPVNSGFGDAVGNGVAAAGAAVGDGLNRSKDKAAKGKILDLETRRVNSEIMVNAAQAKLLESQTLNMNQQARMKAVGARGAVTPLPQPAEIHGPGGKWKTGATTKTQDVEDHYGGAAGEIYGLMRLLKDTYTHSKPNVKLRVSRKGKKPHQSRRW